MRCYIFSEVDEVSLEGLSFLIVYLKPFHFNLSEMRFGIECWGERKPGALFQPPIIHSRYIICYFLDARCTIKLFIQLFRAYQIQSAHLSQRVRAYAPPPIGLCHPPQF
jgi:hypothetical protein